jgi:hypothetical protein
VYLCLGCFVVFDLLVVRLVLVFVVVFLLFVL